MHRVYDIMADVAEVVVLAIAAAAVIIAANITI